MTIDEIRIEGEEDGFHLTIYSDQLAEGAVSYRIGLPDQFDAEVRRTIGAWLAEGEAARVTMPADYGLAREILAEHNPDLARDIERGK